MLIKNYVLKSLKYSNNNFDIYYAISPKSKTPFFLKTLVDNDFIEENTARLVNEFNLLSKCNHKYLLKTISKENDENKLFTVFEFFDGVVLNDYFNQINEMNLSEFILYSIKICEVLNYIHQKKIIHNNINSNAILINKDTLDIKLVGFDFSFIKNQKNNLKSKEISKSIYNSPEQTNRINIDIDYKTDIYSLGIVFYELLAGFIPYNTESKDTISYNIIAKELPLIDEFNKNIPRVLSKIVAKMIEKNPNERYDNITSVLLDLKKIEYFLSNNLAIIDFEINTHKKDFLLGNKNLFFGRDDEVNSFQTNLYSEYEKNRLFIISGASGVGKTTFIKKVLEFKQSEFYNFIDVKFENYKDSNAYKFLYDCFRNLTKQLLIKDDDILNKWKNKISLHLGNEAKVLFEIIPELKVIIEDKGSLEQLNPTESKIRFDTQLFKYLQLFATKEKPLLIFLDDVQWADTITLKWLENALFRLDYLKVIISYRDNELEKNKFLKKQLSLFETFDIEIFEYNLKPLIQKDIKQLIDSNIHVENSEEISKIIFNKTAGNAFFVIQLLKQIQYENILYYDESKCIYRCNLEALHQIKASNNIIEFLEARIETLSEDSIELLKIASCIGSGFEEDVLKSVFNNENFEKVIDSCLKDEWIIKTSFKQKNSYSFSHDRIHQVFYTSIKNEELISYHKKIGDYYFEKYKTCEDYILIYVNHYNKAKKYFLEKNKNDFLAELNYKACLLARKNGDFDVSLNYIKMAFSFYTDINMQKNCDELFKDYAISEHLVLNKTQALYYYEKALNATSNELKKAYLYEQIVKLHTDFSDFKEAYKTGKKALALFKIKIPSGFNTLIFIKEFLYLKFKLRDKKVKELLSLKEAKEDKTVIIIKLLSSVLKAAYQIRPELCVLISMKLVKVCLKHGDTKDAVIGFMVYGVIFQGAVLENHKLGFEYATLALDMIKKYKNGVLEAEVKFVCGYFGLSWMTPASLTEQNWYESYKSGMQIGDWFHSGCAAAGIVQSMFMRGVNLQAILEQIQEFEKSLTKIEANEQLDAIKSVKQAVKNLQGKTNNIVSFSDETFNEEEYIQKLNNFNSLHFAHFYFINKMFTLYIHEKYELAFEISKKSRKYLKSSKGMLHNSEHYFYESLIYLQCYESFNLKDKIIYMNTIRKTIEKFEKYSRDCAENFIVRKYILNAELNRLNKNYIKAQNQLLKAIEIAQIYSQSNLKVIACRLLYKIYNILEQNKFETLYKNEFNNSFMHWGGNKYLDDNEEKKSLVENSLNINTLIKSAEAIFKEQKLSILLKSLTEIILENSGAQNVAIILEDDFEYKVEAISLNDNDNSFEVLTNRKYQDCKYIVHNIIKYVIRTKEPIVINDLKNDPIFSKEKSVLQRGVKSVLSFPLILRNKLKGIIYLENNLLTGVFTNDKINLLKHLSTQIAISIENARIYKNLEQKVLERTKDLDIKNAKLEEQNLILQEQNNKISELNTNIIEENEKRKKVEIKLQEAIKKLDQLATTDGLTQLKNRRVFDTTLDNEISRLNRNKEILSLIMCDVDFFKFYNDLYGHLQGDECLKQVAEILEKNAKRDTDTVARYGGEEFAIIMPNTTKTEAFYVAEKILDSLKKLKLEHAKSEIGFVTLSMGIATSKEVEELTSKTLIRYADNALYKAKRNGRNQIQ